MRWLLNEKITRPSDFFRHPLLHVEASNSLGFQSVHGSAFTLLLEEFEKLRSRWEPICIAGQATIFQGFQLEPAGGQGLCSIVNRCSVVCAEASYGIAIMPVVHRPVMVPCACWAKSCLTTAAFSTAAMATNCS